MKSPVCLCNIPDHMFLLLFVFLSGFGLTIIHGHVRQAMVHETDNISVSNVSAATYTIPNGHLQKIWIPT